MTYNKSEIMKMAWAKFRTGNYYTFGDALRATWKVARMEVETARAKAEREKGTVDASEVSIGDVVAIEYGDYGNHVKCTIIGIGKNSICGHSWYVFNAVSTDGRDREFCVDFGKRVRKVAA